MDEQTDFYIGNENGSGGTAFKKEGAFREGSGPLCRLWRPAGVFQTVSPTVSGIPYSVA